MRLRAVAWSGAALAVAVFVLAAAGCGAGKRLPLSESSQQVAYPYPTSIGPRLVGRETRLCARKEIRLPSSAASFAVLLKGTTPARSLPDAGHLVAMLSRKDLNGFPTVLGAFGIMSNRDCKPAWYHVRLASLPNGSTAWVSAGNVELFHVASRIVVDLSSKRLALYREGRVMLTTTVGIGAPSTPTPTGRFFVNERYLLDSPDGPFGPAVLGISAHSDALAQVWVQHGPIALHGTDERSTIGEAASHGCIRVPNPLMQRLFALAPVGTAVIVRR